LNQFMKAEADRIVKESQAEKDALREQLAKAEAERVEQRERIEKMERVARKTEWIAKAKADLDALPAKSDEIADLIMKAEDNDKEMADKMVTL